jgi:hypothetical protein
MLWTNARPPRLGWLSILLALLVIPLQALAAPDDEDSSRFYLDGSLTGMSFFGYGNFVSANAGLGFPIGKKWDMRVGYLMGSRLRINSSDNEIAIRLTQKGPIVGVERHWGTR